jgi:glutamine amidotransferase-like uncharacterized protein
MVSRKSETYRNKFYQPYLTINLHSALSKPVKINGSYQQHPYPTIGIYCGEGASHSWLWFVEILDALGWWDMLFVDDQQIKADGLHNLDVLLVSGGDTFAIAESLGKEGSDHLAHFLNEGGLYIGSCAGAYLPLTSSLPPLNLFNYASVKISNLTKNLPTPHTLPEKFCTPYGCNYVFHPVREEVKIKVVDFPSTIRHFDELTAPLYGGPSFLPSEDAATVALYTGFTSQTLFLTKSELAHDTIVGKGAIVSKRIGKGQMYLLGPHLEHPRYGEANTLIAEMIYHGMRKGENTSRLPSLPALPPSLEAKKLLRNLKAELSNSRIVALSLEREPIQWQIGYKTYEPEKIRVFLEAMWSRWDTIAIQNTGNEVELYAIYTMVKTLTGLLRSIKRNHLSGIERIELIHEMFSLLKSLTASFLTIYCKERIRLMLNGGIDQCTCTLKQPHCSIP